MTAVSHAVVCLQTKNYLPLQVGAAFVESGVSLIASYVQSLKDTLTESSTLGFIPWAAKSVQMLQTLQLRLLIAPLDSGHLTRTMKTKNPSRFPVTKTSAIASNFILWEST